MRLWAEIGEGTDASDWLAGDGERGPVETGLITTTGLPEETQKKKI